MRKKTNISKIPVDAFFKDKDDFSVFEINVYGNLIIRVFEQRNKITSIYLANLKYILNSIVFSDEEKDFINKRFLQGVKNNYSLTKFETEKGISREAIRRREQYIIAKLSREDNFSFLCFQSSRKERIMADKIENLQLSRRSYDSLIANEIYTISDLFSYDKRDLEALPGIGKQFSDEILEKREEWLKVHTGFKLKSKLSEKKLSNLDFSNIQINKLKTFGLVTIGDVLRADLLELEQRVSDENLYCHLISKVERYADEFPNVREEVGKSLGDASFMLIDFNARAYKCLKEYGVKTIDDLFSIEDADFLSWDNLGVGTYTEILNKRKEWLKLHPKYVPKVIKDFHIKKAEVDVKSGDDLDSLGLSKKAKNFLAESNITTISKLASLTPKDLKAVWGIGDKLYSEIVLKLGTWQKNNFYTD